jgi:hypothetical protein
MFDKDLETVENSCVLRILEIAIHRPVYSLVRRYGDMVKKRSW